MVCGKGNNGGDGFVVARELHRAGRVVEVALLASRTELKGDALTMFERLPVRAAEVTGAQALEAEASRSLANCDLIVDAILGTGFKPHVTGIYAEAIGIINRSEKRWSRSICPRARIRIRWSGKAVRCLFTADAIVTFTSPRPAHVFGELTRGPILVAPIGTPSEAIVSSLNLEVTTPRDFAGLLAPRKRDSNKGLTVMC